MDSYNIAALRGLQAGREYYVAMCPLHYLVKFFLFDEEELPPNLRGQRVLNRSRIPSIAQYVIENPKEYVFSSITACIDGKVQFDPVSKNGAGFRLGQLMIPMDARILVNDGQHRRAAIEEALRERPELRDETISVVFYIDEGLKRSQQMFADLNKHAVRPTKSIGILYDHRDALSQLARKLADTVYVFRGLTDLEKTSISNRQVKLFTLSSIYQATRTLLKKKVKDHVSEQEEKLAFNYWEEVSKYIPEWSLAAQKKVSPAELREDYIHAHGVALQALGFMGTDLISIYPNKWKPRLKGLSKVDWSRKNVELWEGRAMINGRLNKSNNNVMLTVNGLKKILKLPLTTEQEKIENQFLKNKVTKGKRKAKR